MLEVFGLCGNSMPLKGKHCSFVWVLTSYNTISSPLTLTEHPLAVYWLKCAWTSHMMSKFLISQLNIFKSKQKTTAVFTIFTVSHTIKRIVSFFYTNSTFPQCYKGAMHPTLQTVHCVLIYQSHTFTFYSTTYLVSNSYPQ